PTILSKSYFFARESIPLPRFFLDSPAREYYNLVERTSASESEAYWSFFHFERGADHMSKYTKDDIIRMVEEEGVDFIRMQFTDIFGQAKNVAITASQIQKAVNNQISIDGSSIEGFTRIHESDQYLYPDLDTFTILSWYEQQGKVARLL